MTDRKPWTPQPDNMVTSIVSLESAIGQAVGTASMSWEHVERAGVFDEENAKWVLEGLVAWLKAQGAQLGMASTREMLLELRARGEMWPFVSDKDNAVTCGTFLRRRADEALGALPPDMLDERPVKHG